MRRLAGVAVCGLALLAPAVTAHAGVGYQVTVEEPGSVAVGTELVRAHATGGVGDALYAAYQVLRDGEWSDDRRVDMQKVGEGRFSSVDSPWETAVLPNGDYRLEVRVWGDVPPYDPADRGTFAREVLSVSVDNAPSAPEGLEAASRRSGTVLSWEVVPTAGRSDFHGYAVLARRGSGCAGPEGYEEVARTTKRRFGPMGKGMWCYRVVALRRSSVSGTIASAPSEPIQASLGAAVGKGRTHGDVPASFDLITGSAPQADPPPPPELGEGTLAGVSDGGYRGDLPYGSRRFTQEVEGRGPTGLRGSEAGSPLGRRQTATMIAAGLILAAGALLLRRFLFPQLW